MTNKQLKTVCHKINHFYFVFVFSDVKPPAGIKLETVQVKTEVKTEVKSEENSPLPSAQIRVHPVTGLPTKEEEYDSSATVRLFYHQSDVYVTSFIVISLCISIRFEICYVLLTFFCLISSFFQQFFKFIIW